MVRAGRQSSKPLGGQTDVKRRKASYLEENGIYAYRCHRSNLAWATIYHWRFWPNRSGSYKVGNSLFMHWCCSCSPICWNRTQRQTNFQGHSGIGLHLLSSSSSAPCPSLVPVPQFWNLGWHTSRSICRSLGILDSSSGTVHYQHCSSFTSFPLDGNRGEQ